MTVIRQQNEQLQANIHYFMRTVRSLSPDEFTQSMKGWSPRDVVAHLIGWNRAAIDITESIRSEQSPQILIDPGEDFCDVNAAFVRQYNSKDMIELLRELELSYQELARHMYTVDVSEWTVEVAVPGWDQPITIDENIQAISGDYVELAREIEAWHAARAPE